MATKPSNKPAKPATGNKPNAAKPADVVQDTKPADDTAATSEANANKVQQAQTNEPKPTAFLLSAGNWLKDLAGQAEDASAVLVRTSQTTAAIILAICQRREYVPAIATVGAKKTEKQVGCVVTMDTLAGIDKADNMEGMKANGSAAGFTALSTWIVASMGGESQTANDHVKVAARLAAEGYTLQHFNGKIDVIDGRMALSLPEYRRDMPQHLLPGIFTVDPEHIANDSVQAAYPGVKLARMVPKLDASGKPTGSYEPQIDTDTQRVGLTNKAINFLAPLSDGSMRHVRVSRASVATYLKVSADLAKMKVKAAEEAAKEQERQRQAKMAAEGVVNGTDKAGTGGVNDPERGTGEGEPARTMGKEGPQGNGQQQGNGNGQQAPQQGSSQPEKPASAPSGQGQQQQDSQRNAPTETRKDKKEDDEKKPVRPEELVDLIRQNFAVPRLRADGALLRQAVLAYATLQGYLKTMGLLDIVAEASEANVKAMNITPQGKKPAAKPANAAQHAKRTGR